jgi:two-component system, OmpR family, copper resistance phosphate regulon response regulator CusR
MKLLVVEDERRLAQILAEGLREAGYLVQVAFDGMEGLALALTGDFDGIVLDIMLPHRDGLQICRELRRRQVDAAILMLTARDAVEDKVRGLDCGADDYLTKPFAFPEFLARVRSLLRRGVRSRSQVLTIADLEVDTVRREVRRGGQPIRLTAKEYAVLEYLTHNAGRVLTRDQILAHVWPSNYDGYSNTVDVFIRYLRRKIDDGREPKLIQTVIGSGYTLKAPG